MVNQGFGIDGFRHIFWLEWTHRLWGRLLGLVFAVPLIGFAVTGGLSRRLIPRLVLLFVLGGLQGAVGWFMVASGFSPDSTAVAPVRLVIHLGLALALYGSVLWTGLGLWSPQRVGRDRLLAWMAAGLVAMVVLTMLAGGFVAGLHAGLAYNTFPLMDGRLVPETYAQLSPFLRNLTENIATVQFDHRVLATLTALLALGVAGLGLARRSSAPAGLLLLAGIVLAQYALGVATLLLVVPIDLAVAHQAMAVLLLTTALICAHRLRRTGFLP